MNSITYRGVYLSMFLLGLLCVCTGCLEFNNTSSGLDQLEPVYPNADQDLTGSDLAEPVSEQETVDQETMDQEELTQEAVDPCDPNPCQDEFKTQCTDDGEGNPICSCDAGYQDYGDGGCKPSDPCHGDTLCAQQFRQCINQEGEPACDACLGGYHEEGEDCVADQGCQDNTCSGHGDCDDTGGQVSCDCHDPYSGDFCEICELPPNWPQVENWWNGRLCALPLCDPQEPICFDQAGLWQRTLTTTFSDCNPSMAGPEPRVNVGNIDVSSYELGLVGGCDYKEGSQDIVTGVVHGNVEITCDVNLQAWNVTSVETSVVTFHGDRGDGFATVYLYDVPLYSDCFIQFSVLMERL